MKNRKRIIRYSVLGTLIALVWLTQMLPALGEGYARTAYPVISYILSGFSNIIPFALGDLFIALSIGGMIAYPFYARIRLKLSWKKILRRDVEYLLWIYVWFYLAWGLNYSQKNFYERTGVRQYNLISDTLGIHRPPHSRPRVKTMMFTPLISMVGVTGSMGPFFCEFTLNGDLLPPQYPATYTHELAHLLGITSEAEANFYAYQVCTRSVNKEIRFSGYFSILGHVLANARQLMTEEEYKKLFGSIRPEIIELARKDQEYWMAKYSPLIGDIQDWIYDLYLKGNKIESGRKNYSEVIGLLISYNEWKKESNK